MTVHDIYALLTVAGVGLMVMQSFRPRRRSAARGATSYDASGSADSYGPDAACGGFDGGHAACDGGGGDGGSCGGD